MLDHFEGAPWVPCLTPVTLLDVTMRDGGFEVDFEWTSTQIDRTVQAASSLGVEWVEIGYIGGLPSEHGVPYSGLTANLPYEVFETSLAGSARLAAMVHCSALESMPDFDRLGASSLELVRFVYHPKWEHDVAEAVARAKDAGLRTSVNIALASRYSVTEIAATVRRVSVEFGPDVVYIADTCGGMMPANVRSVIRAVRDSTGSAIGFHAHDFLGQGLANAVEAALAGAAWIDASVGGLGRGGGNLALELALGARAMGAFADRIATERLVDLRSELTQQAGVSASEILPMVCGLLNLTPVEEQALVANSVNDVDILTTAGVIAASSRGTSALSNEIHQ